MRDLRASDQFGGGSLRIESNSVVTLLIRPSIISYG